MVLDTRLSPEALGASPRFVRRLCLSPPPPLPPFFHGPPTHRTVRVLASEAEVLIAFCFGLGGQLRVQQLLGPHAAKRALWKLALEATRAALGGVRPIVEPWVVRPAVCDLLLRRQAES